MPPSRTDSFQTNAFTTHTLSALKDVGVPKVRTSVRATPVQVSELQKVFQDTTHPTKEVRESLAERIGLTPEWIISWFMRERKKKKSSRYTSKLSQPETIGQMLGIPQPSLLSDPCPQPIISESPSATANNSFNSTLGTFWHPHYPSAPSAPVLTPSLATAHAVASLPGLDRSYIQVQTTINNAPVWHVLPPSHASAATGQPLVSTASGSSLRIPGDPSEPSYQFRSYVPHTSHFRQSIPSHVSFVNEVSRQPQSFYVPAESSGPVSADTPEGRALSESDLDAQVESHLLGNPTPRKADSVSYVLHTGEPSTIVFDERNISFSTKCGKREDDADGNTAQRGTSHFGPISTAGKPLNDGLITVHTSQSLSGERETDALNYTLTESGVVISTSMSETETAASPVCQGETESSHGGNTETALEPMSEAEAWKKAKEHPEFETFLKIAGVHGNFELTDNGLVLKK